MAHRDWITVLVSTFLIDHFDLFGLQQAVSREELRKRIRAGDVMVLDVRPPDEFARGHVRGAINIRLRELAARLSELDKSHEIVACCRGAYCVLSFEAVAAFRRKGYRARRLEGRVSGMARSGSADHDWTGPCGIILMSS